MRLRGVACALLVLEVRPNPSWDHRIATDAAAEPGQVADDVEGDLRVVRSRPGCTGRRRCGRARAGRRGTAGCRPARPGAARARPNRSSNSDGPKPIVTVSCAGGRPSASPVSSGGDSGDSAPGPTGSPRVIRRRRRSRPRAASRRSRPVRAWSRRTRRTPAGPAPGSRCRPGARRGTARPPRGRRRPSVGAASSPWRVPDRVARRTTDRGAGAAGAERAEEPAPADRAGASTGWSCSPSVPSTVHVSRQRPSAATCESGSASASTDCASARTWSLVSVGVRDEPVAGAVLREQRLRPRRTARSRSAPGRVGRGQRRHEQHVTPASTRRRWPRSRPGRCASSAPPRR